MSAITYFELYVSQIVEFIYKNVFAILEIKFEKLKLIFYKLVFEEII